MILKTNPNTCYFYDAITRKKSTTFIDSPKLQLYYINSNGVENIISNIYIDNRTNIIIAKDDKGTSYIIDDGYRNSMIRSGYVVINGYDKEKLEDREKGTQLHNDLIEDISYSILCQMDKFEKVYKDTNSDYIDHIIEDDGYLFRIRMYNNIDIVKMNQERKINSLPFYSFDKNMDNYGTVYIAIYCKKIGSTSIKNTTVADNILTSIIDKLNNYRNNDAKYVPLDAKGPSIYFSIGETKNVN